MAEQMRLMPPPSIISETDIHKSILIVDQVDLPSIKRREFQTRHDLKARLDEFVTLSGHQHAHMGMTSADVVENTYLIRQRRSVIALGLRHNDTLQHAKLQDVFDRWLDRQQFRGIRGPVGSDVDQLSLLGSRERVHELNRRIASKFGFVKHEQVINAVSQVMPRSFDVELGGLLMGVINADSLGAKYLDLCNGYMTMLTGQQAWLEGDVATSVVRRYVWPMFFHTIAEYLEELHAPT